MGKTVRFTRANPAKNVHFARAGKPRRFARAGKPRKNCPSYPGSYNLRFSLFRLPCGAGGHSLTACNTCKKHEIILARAKALQ